jgi:hypothetical protein
MCSFLFCTLNAVFTACYSFFSIYIRVTLTRWVTTYTLRHVLCSALTYGMPKLVVSANIKARPGAGGID